MPTREQTKMWKNGSTMTNVDYQAIHESNGPSISPATIKGLTDYRRAELESSLNDGYFKNSKGDSVVAGSGRSFVKTAQIASSGMTNFSGSNNTYQMTPELYTPLMLNMNLNMPRERATVNSWIRTHFTFNPYVQNAIDLHRLYPISKLNIKCHDKKVEAFFGNMAEEIDLLNVCLDIAQEYWLIGEAFPFADFDEVNGTWKRIYLQNPDYVVVKKGMGTEPQILIKPDEALKKLVNSNSAADIAQRAMLNPKIIHAVKRGENISTEDYNISHIARRLDITQTRGTGLTVSVFRQLMLMDLIRESEHVQFQDLINPMMVVKVGSTEHKPTPESLEAYRNVFEQATYDKNFRIFTHDAVTIEPISKSAGIYDTSAKYAQLVKELYVGLMVPSVIIEGGGDTTYANGGVTLDVLKQRYTSFRNILSKWLRRKIFAPISAVQGFYEYDDKGKKTKNLIIPEIEWNHMSLFDTDQYINQLIQLTGGEGPNKRASLHTLYRCLGLDYKEERMKMKEEMIDDVILAKEKAALTSYTLEELHKMTPQTEIKEKVGLDALNIPGATGGSAPGAPGAPGGLDLGSSGGLPPMGEPSSGGGAPPPAPPAPPPPSP